MDLICLSHSPLMLKLPPMGEAGEGFLASVEGLRKSISENPPDVVVLFGPDHFNGFRWDVMPSFCIGLGAESTPDWDLPIGELEVPGSLAETLAVAIRAADIDIAVSRHMRVDHGFTIPLKLLFGEINSIPVIPIFINCVAPPLPSCRRSRLLGQAVGRCLAENGINALIVGSGGVSHDPPHARFDDLPEDMREAMLGKRPWEYKHEMTRQRRIIDAATAMAAGEEPCLLPNPKWDHKVLDIFSRQSLSEIDTFDDVWITQTGGSGGHELRTWAAAFAALEAAEGQYVAEVIFHDVVPEWITGMSVMRAAAKNEAE